MLDSLSLQRAGHLTRCLEAGFSAQDIREYGFLLNDYRTCGRTLKELTSRHYAEAGYTLDDFVYARWYRDDFRQEGVTLEHLLHEGFNIDGWKGYRFTDEDLFYRTAQSPVSLRQRVQAGWRQEFGQLASGWNQFVAIAILRELKNGRWTLREFRDAGWQLAEMRDVILPKGLSVYSLQELAGGGRLVEYREAGFTLRDFLESGFTEIQLPY